ncbi:MAG TPA: lipoate--protein ligase family protein, partial [Pirellulales bacterium]|nr:lipoate--protein ligase family protein [Pirellulales bacterium]
ADDRDRFLCFTRRAAVDVLVEGHKVAGSALRRTRAATLLHGSALLARSAHAPELPGINDLVSGRLHADELRCAWLAALQHRLSGAWIASAPTADEQRRADELVDSRYRSDAWTRLR